MIGCDLAAIERGEDRKLFNECMANLGIDDAWHFAGDSGSH